MNRNSNIWRIRNKNSDWFVPFVSRIKNTSDKGFILCPEETRIHGKQRFSFMYSANTQFTLVFGAYDYDWYTRNTDIYNTPNLELRLWQDFFLYFSIYTANNIDYICNDKILCLFSCMNNRAHLHRLYLMEDLAQCNLLADNFYSWHNNDIDPKIQQIGFVPRYFDNKTKLIDGSYTKSSQQYFPSEVSQSCINLVTESEVDCPFITEKTFNCFLFGKIPIIYGYPGVHKKLKDMGYKLPYNIIDYQKIDKEKDSRMRSKTIAEEILRLRHEHRDLNKLNREFLPLVRHNRSLMFSKAKSQEGIPDEVLLDEYYVNLLKKCKNKVINYS